MVFLLGEVGLLLTLKSTSRPTLRRILPLAFLVLLWFDVLTHEPNQNPTVSSSIYEPGLIRTKLGMKPQPALGQTRAMLSSAMFTGLNGIMLSDPKNEFLAKRLAFFSNCNLLDGVPKVDGFFSIYSREAFDVASLLYGSTNVYPKLMDFLSVSQQTKESQRIEWEPRGSWLPEITIGQRPVFLTQSRIISGISSTNFDPAHVVLLPLTDRQFVSVSNQTDARVVSSRFGLQQVEFEIDASEPSIVVVSQTYYHLWRATVDGRPAPLLRANHAFQAVEVPTGRHMVWLKYQNDPFSTGAVLSCFALCACGAGWMRYRTPA